MSQMMALGLALSLLGSVVALATYARAPVTDRFVAWDFALMGGLSAAALGGLGILLAAMTG